MRIVVNDIAASSRGALTVLKDFYNCVRENDRENEWIFLLGDNLLEETDNIRVKVLKDVKASGLKKLQFDFITGKKYISTLEPDVVLSLQNIITFGLKVPQAVYIHQSIPFQKIKKFSFFKGNEWKLAVYQHIIGRIIKLSAKKSQRVLVQTEWIRQAICDSCNLPLEKVVKVMPNVKAIPGRTDSKHFQKNQFFYPTGSGIYKNNDLVFAASQMLKDRGISHRALLTLPEDKSKGEVVCVGKIPYEQVLAHYQTGTLVFPSYMESFGYPLAEARAVGTVVLAADTPFAREVLEGYENAYFFVPFAPEQLADLMEQVATGKIQRKETQQQSAEMEDSWKFVIQQVLQLGK